jgi:hypothetical protein
MIPDAGGNGKYIGKILARMVLGSSVMPRILATILLLVSLAMFVLLGSAAVNLRSGHAVPSTAWTFPLTILGTGALLMWLLLRRQVSMRLYVAAFALWLLAAGFLLAVM